jgi:hypothetical protein
MTTASSSEQTTVEQDLFVIADRWKVPLRRLDGESLREVAHRLTLDLEHRIALMLLDLEEISTLDLDETDGDASC